MIIGYARVSTCIGENKKWAELQLFRDNIMVFQNFFVNLQHERDKKEGE